MELGRSFRGGRGRESGPRRRRVRGSQRRPATCSFPLAQQRTIELPMMPVMKMARLPLNIAKTSIAAAQHFISEIAAAVMERGVFANHAFCT